MASQSDLGARVLVVDDEPRVASLLKRMLRDDTQTVASVREGLALYQQHTFDVVLCDLMMPVMSGVDLYHEFQRLGPGHPERIISSRFARAKTRQRDR